MGYIEKLEIQNLHMELDLELPVSYTRDGRIKEITKNTLTTMSYSKGGFAHLRRNRDLMIWYGAIELEVLQYSEEIDKWHESCDKYYKNKWGLRVVTYWHLRTYKTDTHNYLIHTMDALQRITGVNDRKMLPSIVGYEKAEYTKANILLFPYSYTTESMKKHKDLYFTKDGAF